MDVEKPKYCPKCGSHARVKGKLYRKATLDRILFHDDDAPRLGFKKEVSALSCRDCGYIELYLNEFVD